jgi:KDO2-lipid IV(A) lauroyltransferase
MNKKQKHSAWRRVRQGMESLLLRLFLGLLGRLPVGWHAPLARGVAALFSRVMPLRRGVLDENLDIAFGEQPEAERRRLIGGIYRHTVHFALELARMRRASAEEIRAALHLPHDGQEYLDELLASGRGFIIACAHIGNWEWMGAYYALACGKIGVVYKPMHNADADAVARALRERFGIQILSTRDRVPRALFSLIRAGGAVAILADQDARREGRFVPFFGKPASTAPGLASLAIRLGVPILPGFGLREGPCRFRVKLYPPIVPDPAADPAAEELRLTAQYMARVEDVTRLAPEQYFWWHRRWKTQPKREAEAVALARK